MAIEKRRDKKGKISRYVVRWINEHGEKDSESFKHHMDAKEFERHIMNRVKFIKEGLSDRKKSSSDFKSKKKIYIDDVLPEYIKDLKHKDYAKSTIKKYYHKIDVLLRNFLNQTNRWGVDLNSISASHVEPYVMWRKESKSTRNGCKPTPRNPNITISNKTLNNDLMAFSSFFTWCVKRQYMNKNPFIGFESLPVNNRKLPNFLDVDDIKFCLGEAKKEKNKHLYYILAILIYTGLRRGELANLPLAHVDLKEGCFHIKAHGDWRPKTREERVVFYNESELGPIINEYLKTFKPKEYLFETSSQRKIKGDFISKIVDKHIKNIGLSNKITSVHWTRHTCASLMAKSGTSLSYIQAHLGHKGNTTEMIYMHCHPSHMKKVAQDVTLL